MKRTATSSQGSRGGGLFGALFGGRGGGPSSQPQATSQPEPMGKDKITPVGSSKVAPTVKEVSVGISPYGEVINLPLWERHAILAGQSGSGKSWVSNRLLGEVFKIPKNDRVVAIVDCKGAVEGAKWQRVADAVAATIEEADTVFTNVDAEMKRREALIKSDIAKYWDSRIHPSPEHPYILISIDELAVIGTPIKEDKELEAIRKHAMYMLNELLFRARSSAISVIAAVQRPSTDILPGTTRNNFQNRLVGRVDTQTSSDVCLGVGMAAEGVDASKLTDHWFIAQIEGKGIFRFKTPGEMDDSDLKDVALNPRYYCPKGRGDWLTAEPDTPESIAPWWEDSPYHQAFLRTFRNDDGAECGRDGSNARSGRPQRRPEHPSRQVDHDGNPPRRPRRRPASPDDAYAAPWEEDNPSPRRPRPRRAPRPDYGEQGSGPGEAPSRPRSRRFTQSRDAEDYPDLREVSLDDLNAYATEGGSRPEEQVGYSDLKEIGIEELLNLAAGSASPSFSHAPVDDLKASFEEVDLDEADSWGESVMSEEEDALIEDYEAAAQDVVARIEEEKLRRQASVEPIPLPAWNPGAAEEDAQAEEPRGKAEATFTVERRQQPRRPDGETKPVRRRRRRNEV